MHLHEIPLYTMIICEKIYFVFSGGKYDFEINEIPDKNTWR